MRNIIPILSATLVLAVSQFASAADGSIAITCQRKTIDVNRGKAGGGDVAKSAEDCIYAIKITNNSFGDASAMEVKYVVFVQRERPGEKKGNEHIERVSGAKSVDGIKGRGNSVVETDKITLNQNQLAGGWIYTNGGKINAKDSVKGVWVRVYQGGNMIAEYANPSTIKTREKWEE